MNGALDPSLKAALDKKRIVFTVTTGRSGTAYLATLFRYVRGVDSFHEPGPEFCEVLRSVQHEPEIALQFMVEKKLPTIAKASAKVYVETSHLFCKGFLEPTLQLGIVPDLIIHTRPHRQVAMSLLKMGTIPGRTPKALKFYLSPDDPDVLPLKKWESLQDYQLCFWYCLEMERRARKYEDLYRQLNRPVIKTSLDELKTTRGFLKMLKDLNLQKPGLLSILRHKRNSRFKINESSATKKKVNLPENIKELEEEVIARTGFNPRR